MSLPTPVADEKTQLESVSIVRVTENVTTSPAATNLLLVNWDDPNEKRNPKNWKIPKRIFHTIIPCLIGFEVWVT